MAKELRMNQAQMNEFESKCIDQLPYKSGKMIIGYLSQFVKDIPEVDLVKIDKKDDKKS